MATTDPIKNREYRNRSYARNKAKEIAKSLAYKKARRAELRELVVKAKEAPCLDCGIKYPSYVMDFDHGSNTKIESISVMVNQGVAIQALKDEMAKCEVVCANCHRIRTFKAP